MSINIGSLSIPCPVCGQPLTVSSGDANDMDGIEARVRVAFEVAWLRHAVNDEPEPGAERAVQEEMP